MTICVRDYPWWNAGAPWLIGLVGHLAFDALCLFVFGAVLGWL